MRLVSRNLTKVEALAKYGGEKGIRTPETGPPA